MEILTETINGYKYIHKINSEYGCAVRHDKGCEETIIDRLIEKRKEGLYDDAPPHPDPQSSNSAWLRTAAQ